MSSLGQVILFLLESNSRRRLEAREVFFLIFAFGCFRGPRES